MKNKHLLKSNFSGKLHDSELRGNRIQKPK